MEKVPSKILDCCGQDWVFQMLRLSRTVGFVADHRVTQMSQVDSDLVGPSRVWCHLEVGKMVI